MATNKNSFDGFTGKRGNISTYLRLGVPTSKIAATKITAPPTLNQLIARQPIKVVNDFVASVKNFIFLGFQSEATIAHKTSNDLIMSYTLLNAIKGEYPNKEIDFTKVLFSKGKMPETPEVEVMLNDDGLKYTWNTKLIQGKFRMDDQAMLLAYFPELKSAEHVTNAGKRNVGTAQLSLLRNETPTVMEIYIYFISADHKKVSNSTYLGQLILPATINTSI